MKKFRPCIKINIKFLTICGVFNKILSKMTLKKFHVQVCGAWKRLGLRMNLSCYIGYIESQEKSNSASLRMLLRLWSSAKPECYNVKSLKRVLAAEVRQLLC